jgi:cytidylate kinase
VAKKVAGELGYLYMDSGAMYRGVTWEVLRDGVKPSDSAQVVSVVNRTAIAFAVEDGNLIFEINGRRPGKELRQQVVNENVSVVAAIPEVRAFVVRHLRETANMGDVVMEGRDIGTAVFPDAPAKFYIDASPAERARRRHLEMKRAGSDLGVEEVHNSLASRDSLDSGRAKDPLRAAEDAVVLDTTRLSADEVAEKIVTDIRSGQA